MTDMTDLEARVTVLEGQMQQVISSLSLMDNSLNTFGDYKNRTGEELVFIDNQIQIMMDTLESILSSNMHQTDLVRAKALKKRLKNNQTRARKAKAS